MTTHINKPKVLFVDQSGQMGGAELMLLDLVKSLSCSSVVALLSDGPFAERLRDQSIEVHVCPAEITITKRANIFDALKSIPRIIQQGWFIWKRSRSVQLVYANTAKAMIIAGVVSWLRRKPLVYHLHDILDRNHFSRINLWLLRTFSKLTVSQVIANSQATADSIIALGFEPKRIAVIPNGFHVDPYLVDRSEQRKAFRETLCLARNSRVALVVGRIARWKGQHLLLEAIRDLPDWEAWIVGDALFTQDDRQYKDELLQLAAEHELLNRVRFLGFRDEVIELYAACDVVVHTSTAPEPFGRVIVEAMLSARPVVAADAGGAAEIVEHGKTGWKFSPGSSEELAVLLNQIATNPSDPGKIGQAARISAIERYSLPNVVHRTEQILGRFA